MKNLSLVGSQYYSSTTTNMADDADDLFSHYLSAYHREKAVPVVVEEGMGRNGVLKGTEKNGLVEGIENKGASSQMEDNSLLCAFQVMGVEAPPQGTVNKRGAEWMDGAPPAARGSKRQRSPSGSIETASGGSNDGGGSSHVPHEGMPKRLWVKPKDRDGEWWDIVSRPEYPDADFKRAFHMSRSTFEELCKMLDPAVAKEDTKLRLAIPVRKRVAVCVWRLSTGEPHRPLSKRFGIGITTSHKLVLEVSAAIRAIVLPQVVRWPDATTAASVAAKFQALTGGVPDVIGAVYTTHIPIIAPTNHVANYYNAGLMARSGKVSYSVRLQASVDADGAFTNVCVCPGAVPDQHLILTSWLKTRTGDMLNQGKRLVGGVGSPLMDWMLVPYCHQNLTRTQHEFNVKVAAARAVVVDAFQRFKTRWACLQLRTEIKVDDLPDILSACCALHNLCERNGDELDPEMPSFELVDDEVVAPNPVRSITAAHARDTLANSLLF
ncbi:unnamed protein product [Alopecurus aequalis]